ncbi:MAG: HEAT repeat domain-containing protein [Pirellulaceae bacterium]
MTVLFGTVVWMLPGRLNAQDPFGDPFGGTTAAPTTTTVEPEAEEETIGAGETDPVVLAIRATNPSTPEQLMEAIRNLVNLGRADEAKTYAQILLGLSPDANTLAQLQQKFGSGLFVRLMRKEDFQPEGDQLGRAVLEAGYQAARDPAHLQGLIDHLSDANAELRHTALVDLRDAGEAGVVALIAALADRNRATQHDHVRDALIRLGTISEAPLIGALESPDAKVRTHVIQALGRLRSGDSLPYLLRPLLSEDEPSEVRESAVQALQQIGVALPGRRDAETYLRDQATAYLHGRIPGEPDHEGLAPNAGYD